MATSFQDTTLIRMLAQRAEAWPDKIVTRQKRRGQWLTMKWRELITSIGNLSLSYKKLGLQPGEAVAILADTRREWPITDLATIAAGGVTVGLYTTSTADQMHYILEHSEARILMVQDAALLKRVAPELEKLPHLKHVIVMEPEGCEAIRPGCLSMDDLVGAEFSDEERAPLWTAEPDPETPVCYIYTSGTTGPPKGAILCHRSVLTGLEVFRNAVKAEESDALMSVLPLAHALQRVLDYCALSGGAEVIYAESLATMIADVQGSRPTLIGGVPRLLEKIYEAAASKAEKAGGFTRKVFYWAMKVGREYAEAKEGPTPMGGWLQLKHAIAYKLVFSKVKQALGGKVRMLGGGGAAVAVDLSKFFIACDFRFMEAWGMTETTLVGTLNLTGAFKFGTVGLPQADTQIKIADDGEILIKGSCMFSGYYKQTPEQAAENYVDGWFMTGDVGHFDEDGYLSITDRKKELIITAYGKNISPQNIENTINRSPLIADSYAHGDGQKFLVGLIVPDRERMTATLAEQGTTLAPDDPMEKNEAVRAMIEQAVAEANGKLARHEQIKGFAMLPADFTIDTGELTPTLKLKRRNIVTKYEQILKDLYGENWLE